MVHESYTKRGVELLKMVSEPDTTCVWAVTNGMTLDEVETDIGRGFGLLQMV